MSAPVIDVLDDLAVLLGRIDADAGSRPTPCADFDVAGMRRHVLSWLPVFASALDDPEGSRERPSAEGYVAPADAAQAQAQARAAARTIDAALSSGVADRPVRLFGDSPMPGSAVVGMLTGEMIAHGWDLARGAGQPWDPSPAACEEALATLSAMLTPEMRGDSFGPPVEVPDEAPALERLIAFTGRNPRWQPPAE